MSESEDNRWWIDKGPQKEKQKQGPSSIAMGGLSYDELKDYDQEKVRAALSNINLKLLEEVDPKPRSWQYVSMKPEQSLFRRFEKIKKACPLSDGLRGVAIDSGYSLRLLITGEPLGEKILDIHLTETPSLDLWEGGELVREQMFSTWNQTMQAIRKHMAILMLPPRTEILG